MLTLSAILIIILIVIFLSKYRDLGLFDILVVNLIDEYGMLIKIN